MKSRFINDNDGFVLLPNTFGTSTSNIEYFGYRIFTEDVVKTVRIFGKMVVRETILC